MLIKVSIVVLYLLDGLKAGPTGRYRDGNYQIRDENFDFYREQPFYRACSFQPVPDGSMFCRDGTVITPYVTIEYGNGIGYFGRPDQYGVMPLLNWTPYVAPINSVHGYLVPSYQQEYYPYQPNQMAQTHDTGEWNQYQGQFQHYSGNYPSNGIAQKEEDRSEAHDQYQPSQPAPQELPRSFNEEITMDKTINDVIHSQETKTDPHPQGEPSHDLVKGVIPSSSDFFDHFGRTSSDEYSADYNDENGSVDGFESSNDLLEAKPMIMHNYLSQLEVIPEETSIEDIPSTVQSPDTFEQEENARLKDFENSWMMVTKKGVIRNIENTQDTENQEEEVHHSSIVDKSNIVEPISEEPVTLSPNVSKRKNKKAKNSKKKSSEVKSSPKDTNDEDALLERLINENKLLLEQQKPQVAAHEVPNTQVDTFEPPTINTAQKLINSYTESMEEVPGFEIPMIWRSKMFADKVQSKLVVSDMISPELRNYVNANLVQVFLQQVNLPIVKKKVDDVARALYEYTELLAFPDGEAPVPIVGKVREIATCIEYAKNQIEPLRTLNKFVNDMSRRSLASYLPVITSNVLSSGFDLLMKLSNLLGRFDIPSIE